MDNPLMIVVIVVLVIALIFGMWLIGTYNRFVRLRNLVQESWRQIDVELNRRHSLIPNLIETVKGYMAHERATLEAVVEARRIAEAPASTLAERADKEGALSGALSRLFALSEAYPNLKADGTFLELQRELANTEDRIAAGRRFYNSNVRNLNTKRETFPSSIVGAMFGFDRAEYFEVVDEAVRATPQVNFGFAGAPAGAPGGAGAYGAGAYGAAAYQQTAPGYQQAAPGQQVVPGYQQASGQQPTPGQPLAPGQQAVPGQQSAPGYQPGQQAVPGQQPAHGYQPGQQGSYQNGWAGPAQGGYQQAPGGGNPPNAGSPGSGDSGAGNTGQPPAPGM